VRRHPALVKAAIAIALLVVLYALLGFLLVPRLVEQRVPGLVAEKLGLQASIGSVRFNPFLFRLDARKVRLQDGERPPLAALEELSIDFQLFSSLLRRAWTFSSVRLDGLQLQFDIGPDHRSNWSALTDRSSDSQSQGTPRIVVQQLAVRGQLTVSDRSGPQPTSASVTQLSIDLNDLATLPDREGRYRIAAALSDGGKLQWQGTLSLQPLHSVGELRIEGVRAATLSSFLHDRIALQLPEGTLSASTRYAVSRADGRTELKLQGLALHADALALTAQDDAMPSLKAKAVDVKANATLLLTGGPPQFDVTDLELQLQQLVALPRSPGTQPLTVASVALRGGKVDANARKVVAQELVVQGGHIEIERASDGSVTLLKSSSTSRATVPATTPRAKAPAGDKAEARWQVALGHLQINDIDVALRDRSFEPPLALRGRIVSASAKGYDSSGSEPLQVQVQAQLAEGGTLEATGGVARDGTRIDLDVRVDALALRPLQPVLTRYATLTLESGSLSATAKVAMHSDKAGSDKAGLSLQVNGDATLADVLVNEAATKERFLAWKTLQASGIAYDAATPRLAVRQIDLLEPGAKLLIAKQRQVNLTQILKPQAGRARGAAPATSSPSSAPAPAPAQTSPAPSASPATQITIERIRLRRGVLDYADLSLVLPFSTRITRINGTILDISNARDARTQVQANGQIEPFGSASVNGSLTPFDPKRFMDLQVRMNNVDMPPLSPYTATFAGRKVDAGKLWLDLSYKIVDNQLLGDNKIRLSDFKLGERVEAPGGLDLPLDMAVALLTDDQGRIDVAVPVRGDVGKPTFDVGAVIREALGNLLRRIVTAPFRALGRLAGGGEGDDKLAAIEFVPGSARLRPEQQEKLTHVAGALAHRPQLKLVVHGPYAEQRDARALRERAVRRELAKALGEGGGGGGGDEFPPLAFGNPRTQWELERMFNKYAGAAALRELQASQRKTTSAANNAAAPASDADAAFYRVLFDRLIDVFPARDADVQELAARRASAIRDYLVQSANAPADRVEIGAVERAPDDAAAPVVATTLQLQPLTGTSRAADAAPPGRAASAGPAP
jgi:hypothetical protein